MYLSQDLLKTGNILTFFVHKLKTFLFIMLCWGRRGIHIGYWLESQKERDHWEDQGVGGWTILKWMYFYFMHPVVL
jgi:hypothetical protein